MPPPKMCPAVWSLANTCSLSLDDIHVVSKPGRVGRIHDIFGSGTVEAFWDPDPPRKDTGVEPREDQARRATGWNESPRLCTRKHECGGGPCCPQTVKVLKCSGIRLGHPHYVARHLQGIVEEHQTLLDRIPHVKDLQSAWLLCLSSSQLPALVRGSSWQCSCNILQIDPT